MEILKSWLINSQSCNWLTLKTIPLIDSSVFPPIGGAASPVAIKPIEDDVDIFDKSSDNEVVALGNSDADSSDNNTFV